MSNNLNILLGFLGMMCGYKEVVQSINQSINQFSRSVECSFAA